MSPASYFTFNPLPPLSHSPKTVTSADEFVLQLLTDKGIVESAAIEDARVKAAEQGGDGNPDTAALDLLVT